MMSSRENTGPTNKGLSPSYPVWLATFCAFFASLDYKRKGSAATCKLTVAPKGRIEMCLGTRRLRDSRAVVRLASNYAGDHTFHRSLSSVPVEILEHWTRFASCGLCRIVYETMILPEESWLARFPVGKARLFSLHGSIFGEHM